MSSVPPTRIRAFMMYICVVWGIKKGRRGEREKGEKSELSDERVGKGMS
jgi:hypothetical protein